MKKEYQHLKVPTKSMKLDQFLKWMGWVATGGEAKMLIQSGTVQVNGGVELRRGRQLVPGDLVKVSEHVATFNNRHMSST